MSEPADLSPNSFGFSLAIIVERSGYYLLQGNPQYGTDEGKVQVYWGRNPFSSNPENLWTSAGNSQIGTKEGNRMGYAVAGTRGMSVIACPMCTQGSVPYGNIRIYSNEAPSGRPTGQPTGQPTKFIWPTMEPTIFKDFQIDVPGVAVDNAYEARYTFQNLGLPATDWYLSIQVLNTGFDAASNMYVTTTVGGAAGEPPVALKNICYGPLGSGSPAGGADCSSLDAPRVPPLRPGQPFYPYAPPDSEFTWCTYNYNVRSSIVKVR